jgi:hypothetical protein
MEPAWGFDMLAMSGGASPETDVACKRTPESTANPIVIIRVVFIRFSLHSDGQPSVKLAAAHRLPRTLAGFAYPSLAFTYLLLLARIKCIIISSITYYFIATDVFEEAVEKLSFELY